MVRLVVHHKYIAFPGSRILKHAVDNPRVALDISGAEHFLRPSVVLVGLVLKDAQVALGDARVEHFWRDVLLAV